jgi:hypothetical protein
LLFYDVKFEKSTDKIKSFLLSKDSVYFFLDLNELFKFKEKLQIRHSALTKHGIFSFCLFEVQLAFHLGSISDSISVSDPDIQTQLNSKPIRIRNIGFKIYFQGLFIGVIHTIYKV